MDDCGIKIEHPQVKAPKQGFVAKRGCNVSIAI